MLRNHWEHRFKLRESTNWPMVTSMVVTTCSTNDTVFTRHHYLLPLANILKSTGGNKHCKSAVVNFLCHCIFIFLLKVFLGITSLHFTYKIFWKELSEPHHSRKKNLKDTLGNTHIATLSCKAQMRWLQQEHATGSQSQITSSTVYRLNQFREAKHNAAQILIPKQTESQ